MITQPYKLNLIPGGVPVRVPVSQYDAGSRDITFSLYSGCAAFAVPAGAVVTCDGAKPDRKGFSYLATASGSTVTVAVTEQMTAVAGEVDCQITIRKDGQVLGSANFLLVVERAALPDGADISETEINAFTQIANQAAEAAQSAQEAVDALDGKKAALDASTAAANTANTNLATATSTANTARTNLTSATSTANTARTELAKATTAANTAKDALQKPTSDARDAKSALDSANQAAAQNLEALNDSAAMTQKIPKVSPAVAGNLAALKADGALEDSGKKPGDFAPGGYGLGGSGRRVTEITDDLNNLVQSGWYDKWGTDTVANCPVQYAGVFVCTRSPSTVTQIVFDYGTNYGSILIRRFVGSTWSDWEWVNPPMVSGVEYRTTRKDAGYPVYAKMVRYRNDAQIGTTSSVTDIKIPHGISNFSALTECVAVRGIGTVLPYVSYKTIDGIPHYAMTGITYVDGTNINLRIVNDYWGTVDWYFALYYTKKT